MFPVPSSRRRHFTSVPSVDGTSSCPYCLALPPPRSRTPSPCRRCWLGSWLPKARRQNPDGIGPDLAAAPLRPPRSRLRVHVVVPCCLATAFGLGTDLLHRGARIHLGRAGYRSRCQIQWRRLAVVTPVHLGIDAATLLFNAGSSILAPSWLSSLGASRGRGLRPRYHGKGRPRCCRSCGRTVYGGPLDPALESDTEPLLIMSFTVCFQQHHNPPSLQLVFPMIFLGWGQGASIKDVS